MVASLAKVSLRPVALVDTKLFTSASGDPNRVAVNSDGNIYLVTAIDSDSYYRVVKLSSPTGAITTYTSQGTATALDADFNQGKLACAIDSEDILYILHIVEVGADKLVYSNRFNTSNDSWGGTEETVLTSAGVAAHASDSLDVVCDTTTVHAAIWRRSGSSSIITYATRVAAVWTTETVVTQTPAPSYLPRINVSGGRVIVLGDNGTGDLITSGQWSAYETPGTWTTTAIAGYGQASIAATDDGTRHVLFTGDKRHTLIKGPASGLTSTVGAIVFEQPDVDGGIVEGVSYISSFGIHIDGDSLHVVAASSGRLYQGEYVANKWKKLRAIADLSSSRTSFIIAQLASIAREDNLIAVAKLDTDSKTWLIAELDKDSPPRGGVTHDIVIDDEGYMLVGSMTKADISQAIPRVSLATEVKREENFSDLTSITQQSFHHGRGEREFSNPLAFLESDGLLTHISNQVTPQYADTLTVLAGGAAASSWQVGPGGRQVGTGTIGIGPALPATASGAQSGYPVDALLYNGNFYVLIYGNTAATNALIVWNNTTGVWDVVVAGLDTTNGAPSDLEIHNQDLWVAQGEAVNARVYDASAAGWVAGGVPADAFASWDGKLWRADNINEIYYSSNADTALGAAAWTLLGVVDDGSGTTARIRGFEPYGGNLLVFANFGVNMIFSNGDGTYQILPLLNDRAQRSGDNGKARANYGGLLMYNVGDGITRFDGSTRQDVGPNRSALGSSTFRPLITSKHGNINYMVSTDTLLYAAIDIGTVSTRTSTVMVYSGTGWSEFWKSGTAGNRCRWVYYTPALTTTGVLEHRNLWVEDGGTIRYIRLPDRSENPLHDTALSVKAGGSYSLITGWQHHGLPALQKVVHEIVGRFENFGDGEFDPNLHIYYQIDEGTDSFDIADWSYLTTLTQNPTEGSRVTDRTLLAAHNTEWVGAAGGLSYRQIRFLVVFDMNLGGATSTTTKPVLRGIGHRFAVRTQTRYGWTPVVKASDKIQRYDGVVEENRSDKIRNKFYAAQQLEGPHYLDDGTLTSLINWVKNPSFEFDDDDSGLADGWTALNTPTTTISNKHKTHGRSSQKVVVTGTTLSTGIYQRGIYLPAGVPAHVEANIFVETGVGAVIEVTNAATGSVLVRSDPVFPFVNVRPPAKFVEVHVDIPVQSILTELSVRIIVPTNLIPASTASTTFYSDAVFCYFGDEVPHLYVDGDQPRCQWIDSIVTPYLAPSFRRGTYAVYITGLNEVFRFNRTQTDEVLRESQITLFLREAAS